MEFMQLDELEKEISEWDFNSNSLDSSFTDELSEHYEYLPMSELCKRQTGRTHRMILFLAESIRRNELSKTNKKFLIVGSYRTESILKRVYRLFEEKGYTPKAIRHKFLGFEYTRVYFIGVDDLEDLHLKLVRGMLFGGGDYFDDIFVDNVVMDNLEWKIKKEFLK